MSKHGIGALAGILQAHNVDKIEEYTESEVSSCMYDVLLECAEMNGIIDREMAMAAGFIAKLAVSGENLTESATEDKLDVMLEAAGASDNPLKRFWKFLVSIFNKVYDYIKRAYTRFALNAKKLNRVIDSCKTKLTAAKSKPGFNTKSVDTPGIIFNRMALAVKLLTDQNRMTTNDPSGNAIAIFNEALNKEVEAAAMSGDFSRVKTRLKDKDISAVIKAGNKAGMLAAMHRDKITEVDWSASGDSAPTTKQVVDSFTARDSVNYSGDGLLQFVNVILESMTIVNINGVVNSIKKNGNSMEKEQARFKKMYDKVSKGLKKDSDSEVKELSKTLSKYYSITMSAYTTSTDYALNLLAEYVKQVNIVTNKIVS